MHKFLRSIGFQNIERKSQLKNVINEIIQNPDEQRYVSNHQGVVFVEFRKNYAEHIGLCVCGQYDEENKFMFDYIYPYIIGTNISSKEDVTIERHISKESYAGVCDDLKIGVSLIFYLLNRTSYLELKYNNKLPVKQTTLSLSALAINGIVMMPINKNESEKKKSKKASINRNHLIEQARLGDEEAIESLTLEDMDTYTMISKKIQKEDVFSLVDTYFMPYGVECDQYSILGEILAFRNYNNIKTEEEIVVMNISCNDLLFDLCINKKELYGEPKIGRRIKAIIWLQGYINFDNYVN